MININISGEAISRNTFALEFKIYQKKSLGKPTILVIMFWDVTIL